MADALAAIITANFTLEYFPLCFRCVKVVVLIKLEKTGKVLHTPEAYRLIVLLSFINKVIKKMINERITVTVEKHNLLL